MESHYLINVAKYVPQGAVTMCRHHFAAKVRDRQQAYLVFAELQQHYPEPAYKVSMTYWQCSGSAC